MPRNTRLPTTYQQHTKPPKSALRRKQTKPIHHAALTQDEHEHHHPASESEAGPESDSSESVSDERAGDAQDDDDVDVDAPRVVQWADAQDEDSEGLSGEETDDEDANVLPAKSSRDLVRFRFIFTL
jgi:hypothetical protein